MTRTTALLLTLLTGVYGQKKPPNIPDSTWVREDVFAGFMVGDQERFERGVKKIEAILADQPGNSITLAWRASTQMYRAVRAHEAGDKAGFEAFYKNALKDFSEAKPNSGVFAIEGGTFTTFADRLPPEYRAYANERTYTQYKALETAQAKIFDKLPLHLKGEVLAGIAQSAYRLGKTDEAQAYMQRVVNELPGTVYESRVRLWMQKPEVAGKTSMTCQTCHEDGRLKKRFPDAE